MREFQTALRSTDEAKAEKSKPVTTKIDGYMVTFRGASVGQVSMALATAQAGNLGESIAVTINLFFGLIQDNPELGATGNPKYNIETGEPVWDKGSEARIKSHFRHRLFDPEDDFGPEVISDVLRGLVEEWTGNPTQQPRSSSATPQDTGSTLTAPTPASTSSAFGLTGSST